MVVAKIVDFGHFGCKIGPLVIRNLNQNLWDYKTRAQKLTSCVGQVHVRTFTPLDGFNGNFMGTNFCLAFWAAAPKGTKSCRTQRTFVYLSVRSFVRPSAPPGPLRPETCHLRPKICPLRPEICPLRPWIWEGRFKAWQAGFRRWPHIALGQAVITVKSVVAALSGTRQKVMKHCKSWYCSKRVQFVELKRFLRRMTSQTPSMFIGSSCQRINPTKFAKQGEKNGCERR